MRNLSVSSVLTWALPATVPGDIDQPLSSITFDLDEQTTYAAIQQSQAAIAITLLKLKAGRIPEQRAVYSSIEPLPASHRADAPALLSFHFLPESRNVVLILANGEIVLGSVDADELQWDVVGGFEGGLRAAAWSPDDTLLVLATADGKLVQMTTDFEALHEKPLRTTEFGEDAQVNVNWGSKATQFHGSLGKGAAAASANPPAPIGSSPDDDGGVRISWRGDAAYFVVSTLDPYEDVDGNGISKPATRRVVRVYDRDVVLQSTLEPTAGLEHPLAWRPSGNFIATTQRFFGPESGHVGGGVGRQGRHDIVFFERNGLRRLEFDGHWIKQLQSEDQWNYKVKDMSWSCDSNTLAVWICRDGRDVVQLWASGNWHWYLKLELTPTESKRFTTVRWHPEQARTLLLASDASIREYSFEYETCTSIGGPPDDLGMVAVVDKGSALLTPFRIQNVPPPAASYTLKLNEKGIPPLHIALSPSANYLAALQRDETDPGSLKASVWPLNPRRLPGRGKTIDPGPATEKKLELVSSHQILVSETEEGDLLIALAGQDAKLSGTVTLYRLSGHSWSEDLAFNCEPNGRLLYSDIAKGPILWQAHGGQLIDVRTSESFSSFPEFCFQAQLVTSASNGKPFDLVLGLSTRGKLYVASIHQKSAVLVHSAATSVVVAGSFLIFVTSAHESVYAPLTDITTALSNVLLNGADTAEASVAAHIASLSASWEKRRVERGSRIVTAVPSAMNVVLQMPRGNLETINPRPLALEVIRADIERLDYGKAFLACRKHRIDLEILVEQDSTIFLEKIPLFVSQVSEVDDLNLFLTVLGRSKVDPTLISSVCNAVREELQKLDPIRYVNTILTSHVAPSPPNYEDALSYLHKLRANNSEIVEDAVRYIIFLVDAEKLFDIALGMYDFTLVLLIAQHSQRDPREYLPFLRELKALDSRYQKFKIDDHLKRYPKALKSLHEAGSERFGEALKYIELHKLYKEALGLWSEEKTEYKAIMDIYGDFMFDRREFEDAALAFQMAEKPQKAMLSYEKAHQWRDLFFLATQNGLSEDKLIELAYRASEDLAYRKRWTDAAAVYRDYANDIEACVRALTNGNELSEALRTTSKYGRSELVQTVIHPGALDLVSQLRDELEEMDGQLQKQYGRLQELRQAKDENPDAFFGAEDTTLHNVDVRTDVSTPFTTFTRYTKAPTSVSRAGSSRTSRSKRKLDMKNAAGRRGTAEEDVYIKTSWAKLSTRLGTLQADAGKLLPHLLLFSGEHVEEGRRLQSDILRFEADFKRMVDEIWAEDTPVSGTNQEDLRQMQDTTEKKQPPRPAFPSHAWVVRFWSE